jgi:hypothetical protein
MLPAIHPPVTPELFHQAKTACSLVKQNFERILGDHGGVEADSCIERVNHYIEATIEYIRRKAADPESTSLFGNRVITIIHIAPITADKHLYSSTPHQTLRSDADSIALINEITELNIKTNIYYVFAALFNHNFNQTFASLKKHPSCEIRLEAISATGGILIVLCVLASNNCYKQDKFIFIHNIHLINPRRSYVTCN